MGKSILIFCVLSAILFQFSSGLSSKNNFEGIDFTNVDEGPCSEEKPVEEIDVDWVRNIFVKWLPEQKYLDQGAAGWFIPMMSLTRARVWVEYLTGKPFESAEQLKGFCPRLRIINSTITVTGFGKKLVLDCVERPDKTRDCFYAEGSTTEKEWADGLSAPKLVATLTDSRRFVVMVGCAKEQRSWAVVSPRSYVDYKPREGIQKHLEGLGFDLKKFVFISYDGCWL